MQDITQAILQLGVAPAIAGFLLYDYSKKLAAIQAQLVQQTEILRQKCQDLEALRTEIGELRNELNN